MIPYGRQEIIQKDIDAVVEVLQSDFITQGPNVPKFEKAIAEKVEARYAVAVNSATSALHLACRALGVGEGDCVWTSPITFVASANCARYCGAEIDFVDIDPKTYNISVAALEKKLYEISKSKGTKRLPKVVIPVHLCGQSCEMTTIRELSHRFGFAVIEDASHAIGGFYKDDPIGCCRYSDIAVFSFHPVKIITTGEGGVAVTNRADLAERMSLLRSHGITRDADLMTQDPDGPWYYQQIDLGYNYRMTDLQAALGLSQIDRLRDFVNKRHLLANYYDKELAGLPVITPWQHPDTYSSFHLYPIRLRLDKIKNSRREIFEMLRQFRIGVNVHYIPVYLHPYYRKFGFSPDQFPESQLYYDQTISLPLYPGLTKEMQDTVCNRLHEILNS